MHINITAQHKEKVLLLDFDGTLSEYLGHPPEFLPGNPLPGVAEFLPKLHKEGWCIHIWSGRVNYPEGLSQIATWMDQQNLPYDLILSSKPKYHAIVDDNSLNTEKGWASIYSQLSTGKVGIKASKPGTEDHSYSSTHVVLPKELGDKLIAWSKKNVPEGILDKEEGGREAYPHITILYGIHSEGPKPVQEVLKNEKPAKFKLGKVSLFKNEDKPFDVVKVEVISLDLHRLNKELTDNLEYTNSFPKYTPHATIAYVQKGTADQLEGNTDLEGLEATVDWIEFSSKSKEVKPTCINLCKTKEAYLALTHTEITSAFTPSLVNAPDNPWQSDSDKEIPTRPEWADCEQTWHFPYVKRHDDTDMVLSQVIDVEKEGGKKEELALALGLALAPTTTHQPNAPTPQVEHKVPRGWHHYLAAVEQAASKYKVPLEMFTRLLQTENTTGNPHAVNPSSGAVGLAQFMPGTAQELGIDPTNPLASIDASAKYLKALHNQFGNWEDAVKAYNWGPGNVEKSRSEGKEVPSETQEYLEKVQPTSKESAKQPNTTWDGNEPFEVLPTNWVLNTNDDNLWQQYSRQYKALKENPYWDNLGLIFNFMMDKHEDHQDNELFQVVSAEQDYMLVKKAQTNLLDNAKILIEQIKESLKSTQNVAFKAEQLISRLEDLLQDAETETQVVTAVQSTIGYLQELGSSIDPVVHKLQELLTLGTKSISNLISFREIKAQTYSDKEMDQILTDNRKDSGDWFKDDVGGGNTPHDWNSSTNDFPQPKDMQKGTPLDQLVPVDRRFDQQINPPTSSPADFIKAPTSDGDMGDYDYKKWKKANLISHIELVAANLIDLVYVKVIEINDDFSEVKGVANMLGKLVPWSAKVLPTSGDLRMYKIDTTEIEKAINKANITAPHKRDQLEKVTEKIREQITTPTSSFTYRDIPSESQINQLWDSIPQIWWTKQDTSFLGKKTGPQTTTLKLDYVKDLLRRNKFDSSYFNTFPNGRNDEYSWSLVGQSMLLTKYKA